MALNRASQKDWEGARQIAAPLGPVAADVIELARLRSGDAVLGDYEAFLARRADWPGLGAIRSKGEEAVARSTTPQRILDWFGERAPATIHGAEALARALRESGRAEEATAMLNRFWTGASLTAEDERLFLSGPGATLGRALHEGRLDNLLWRGRLAEARRMLPLVGEDWRKLAEARIALREDREGVDRLLAEVPRALAEDPGLAHARFEWRMRKGRTEAALEILTARSTSPEALGRPEAWATRRANLARAALRDGNGKLAESIAASHQLTSGADRADLEFLAGFAALRFNKDPAGALSHFQKLSELVKTPISVSRADYWQGRALEALGRQDEARAAHARAAQHQTAYYGLLSAETLGLPYDAELTAKPSLVDWRQGDFLQSSVTEAALLYYQIGDANQARRFLMHLAEGQDAAGLEAMGAFALAKDDPYLAVLIGKLAAGRGIILPGIYYPDPAILPQDLAVERTLALAIARRESEFRVEATSSAGALGLMQLMPGTAKLMATKLGIENRPGALTSDPGYNAKLGSAYLAHLAEEFGPSIALRAAGYNAGPGRPRAWITQIGDPRQAAVDVVDWVEMVPFSETRTYVMRVTEGVAVYAAREAGPGEKVSITPYLRGSYTPR